MYSASCHIQYGAGCQCLGVGTVNTLGQDAEHERITRRAFTCSDDQTTGCLEKKTLNKVAGKRFSFGAVGFPDLPTGDLPSQASAHCDGGDYLEIEGYEQTAADAQAALTECRDWIARHFDHAVSAAAAMLDKDGEISKDQTKLARNCIKDPTKDSTAKCRVLTHFGIMLHAVQDFYSHTNWTDHANNHQAIGPRNPPGLVYRERAMWLAVPTSAMKFPTGLISGCYEGLIESNNCNYRDDSGAERERVKHTFLNKDKGVVDPDHGEGGAYPDVGGIGPGKTDRGRVSDNFQQAVRVAVLDTQAKLAELKAALAAKYGSERGARLYCAIIHDKPTRSC